jgi:hypothetical protein
MTKESLNQTPANKVNQAALDQFVAIVMGRTELSQGQRLLKDFTR